MKKLLAGAASSNITPKCEMQNYNGAIYRIGKENSNIFSQIIMFKFSKIEALLISSDITFIDRALVLRIRKECQKEFKIPGKNIMIAANHNHTSPATCRSFLSGAFPQPEYLDFLVNEIINGVRKAINSLEPIQIKKGTCQSPGYEVNRRLIKPDGRIKIYDFPTDLKLNYQFEGPIDDKIQFIILESEMNGPISFIVNYACHNNCTGSFGGYFHGDLFGSIGNFIQARFPSVKAVSCLAAPCGNVAWYDPFERKNISGTELAREIGEKVANNVIYAYKKLKPMKKNLLIVKSKNIKIKERSKSESTFCEDGCRGESKIEMKLARRRYDLEKLELEKRGYGSTCDIEIQGIRLGDVAIISNPCELFVEFGLEIKKKSPFTTTLISSLTNGYYGYVPTEKAYLYGGYETHRTVYTSRLEKSAGSKIVKTSLSILNELKNFQDGKNARF